MKTTYDGWQIEITDYDEKPESIFVVCNRPDGAVISSEGIGDFKDFADALGWAKRQIKRY